MLIFPASNTSTLISHPLAGAMITRQFRKCYSLHFSNAHIDQIYVYLHNGHNIQIFLPGVSSVGATPGILLPSHPLFYLNYFRNSGILKILQYKEEEAHMYHKY